MGNIQVYGGYSNVINGPGSNSMVGIPPIEMVMNPGALAFIDIAIPTVSAFARMTGSSRLMLDHSFAQSWQCSHHAVTEGHDMLPEIRLANLLEGKSPEVHMNNVLLKEHATCQR